MPSRIVSRMQRKKPSLTVAIGIGKKPGTPSGAEEMMPAESVGEPMTESEPGHQSAQMAYEKVMEGLQELAPEYPEAAQMLQQFEAMWAKWMGGKESAGPSGPGQAEADTGKQADKENPYA